MINTKTELNETIIDESDNISSQYKLSKHFSDLQNVANKHKKIMIRIYGTTGHGKGEVDHAGDTAKVSIRKAVASGLSFSNSEEMVDYLDNKFKDSTSPKYYFKETDAKKLD